MKAVKMAKGERHESPKELHHLTVTPGEGGGHVVEHHFKVGAGGTYHEPEMHPFGADEGPKALEHIASAAGIKTSEPSEAEGKSTGENEEV